MARRFGAQSQHLPSTKLNNGAAHHLVGPVLTALHRHAETPWQRICAAWFDAHEGPGERGWTLEHVGWSESEFDQQRHWLLEVFDAAAQTSQLAEAPGGSIADHLQVVASGLRTMTLEDVVAYREQRPTSGVPLRPDHLIWGPYAGAWYRCPPMEPDACPTCGRWIWARCSRCGPRQLTAMAEYEAREMVHRGFDAPVAVVVRTTNDGVEVLLRGGTDIQIGSFSSVDAELTEYQNTELTALKGLIERRRWNLIELHQ